MEELFCIGCGAPIQTENKEGLGFTPQSALEKGLETGEVYCQRCFRLRHYNEITDVHLTDDDFLKLLHEVDGAGPRRRHASCRCGPHLCSKQERYQGLDGKD